jgi:hypothetical protein
MKLTSTHSKYQSCDYLIKFKSNEGLNHGLKNYIITSDDKQVKFIVNELNLID